ncbi:MAG TPA: hypothetical protein VMS11_07965 [Solirubrobacterales bacterium]|nr:hypothetical protein [Solirubrobacterales bacterium]
MRETYESGGASGDFTEGALDDLGTAIAEAESGDVLGSRVSGVCVG